MKQTVLAVILAGIAGTLANALAAGIFLGTEKFNLALVPGRYAVAIACACLLWPVYRALSGTVSHLTALVLLTLTPSLIAKLVFGAGAPWGLVLALNAVYALAAWGTYIWVAKEAR